MQLAQSSFECADLAVRPKLYELYARDLLLQDPRFHKGRDGVLLIHYACGCNDHVEPTGTREVTRRRRK